MFSFFKNKNIDRNDENIFSKVGSLLIHIAKIDQNYDGFRDRFLKDFSGFLAPKWSQVGTKIGHNTDLNFQR